MPPVTHYLAVRASYGINGIGYAGNLGKSSVLQAHKLRNPGKSSVRAAFLTTVGVLVYIDASVASHRRELRNVRRNRCISNGK
jgi:hypothetical protein